ncbi:MAG: histidine phosphatase family protein [Candidatus Woesearchaeota archaeon]
MKLILIRHGETEHNVQRLCQGQLDNKLSDKGVVQAKKLGKRFKNYKFDLIYSSDLTRAKDTAKEILKHHEKKELILDERLRERYFGKLQGKPFPKDFDWYNLPSHVESHEAIQKRVKEFFEDIYAQHKNKTVLVVFHGGAKRALISALYENAPQKARELEKPKNTSVTEINIKENKQHELIINNCTKHLD